MDVQGQAPTQQPARHDPPPSSGSRSLPRTGRGPRDPRRLAVAGAALLAVFVAGGLVARGLGGDDVSPAAIPTAAPAPSSTPDSAASSTPGVPVAPRTGPGLLGVSVPRVQGQPPSEIVSSIKQKFGGLPVARIFSATLPPATWDTDPTLAALGAGSAVVYSFKGDVAAVAGGQYDAQITQFLTSRPAGVTVWVAFHHEPEDEIARGDFTAEQFRAATEHLAPVIRAAGGIPTTILMQYTLSSESGRDWHDYYSPATDVLAWDAYNSGQKRSVPTYKPAQAFVDPVLAVAKETGKPFGWAEFGSPCITSDPGCTGRAAWLTTVGEAFRNAGAQFATYWNAKSDVDYTLADPGSVSAFRQLVAH